MLAEDSFLDAAVTGTPTLARNGVVAYEANRVERRVADAAPVVADREPEPATPALIAYTSGTSGRQRARCSRTRL
jgi:long-subunit acyl-CoA synthetase (AMP-forming)